MRDLLFEKLLLLVTEFLHIHLDQIGTKFNNEI